MQSVEKDFFGLKLLINLSNEILFPVIRFFIDGKFPFFRGFKPNTFNCLLFSF